jgi:hypothetical protein
MHRHNSQELSKTYNRSRLRGLNRQSIRLNWCSCPRSISLAVFALDLFFSRISLYPFVVSSSTPLFIFFFSLLFLVFQGTRNLTRRRGDEEEQTLAFLETGILSCLLLWFFFLSFSSTLLPKVD